MGTLLVHFTIKMALALRSLCRQGRYFRNISCVNNNRITLVPVLKQHKCLSTSKNDKNAGASIETIEQSEEFERLKKRFENTDPNDEENYISYGYCAEDRDEDWFHHNFVSFMVFSVGFFVAGFMFAYMPDPKYSNWAAREAFLQMEIRERQGKPLVDCNYVDPSTISLPSDEDLGDTEIVI